MYKLIYTQNSHQYIQSIPMKICIVSHIWKHIHRSPYTGAHKDSHPCTTNTHIYTHIYIESTQMNISQLTV